MGFASFSLEGKPPALCGAGSLVASASESYCLMGGVRAVLLDRVGLAEGLCYQRIVGMNSLDAPERRLSGESPPGNMPGLTIST